tara:strand:+ start:2332 stop:2760 length:429 start_codon:yes stop_codon:yes gene_type:complete
MILSIHSTFKKGEKAFKNKKFAEAKKYLNKVIDHDTNHYASYLILFEILNKSNSSEIKEIVNELRRLNPNINLNYKPINSKRIIKKKTAIVTISYIKLMIQQGKILQAKRSLSAIIKDGRTKKSIQEAERLLKTLNTKKDSK